VPALVGERMRVPALLGEKMGPSSNNIHRLMQIRTFTGEVK
jgi:hypothetical protein